MFLSEQQPLVFQLEQRRDNTVDLPPDFYYLSGLIMSPVISDASVSTGHSRPPKKVK